MTLQFTGFAFTFIFTGMLLGNLILIYMGALPLIFVFLVLPKNRPLEVSITRLIEDQEVLIEDVVPVSFKVEMKGGLGLVTFGCSLPPHFILEKGSNFVTLWKGFSDVEKEIIFEVRCTKRGVYEVGEVSWEIRPPLQFTSNTLGTHSDLCTLVVRPQYFNVRRIRDKKIFTRMPMPTEAKILLGVTTTDFKEIRDYRVGDPFKIINWKATARLQHRYRRPPMVNEFEKEGRKVVWIALNTASRMFKGSSTRNCFEYAIQSVLELSEFYLSRECKVGLIIYNDDYYTEKGQYPYLHQGLLILPGLTDSYSLNEEGKILNDRPRMRKEIMIPDTGRGQQQRILDKMLKIRTTSLRPSLSDSIVNARGHIQGTSPLFIILTTVDEAREEALMDGLEEINKFAPRKVRGGPPILLVHISGHELVEGDELPAGFRDIEDQIIINRIGREASTVQWNPRRERLSHAILRQVVK